MKSKLITFYTFICTFPFILWSIMGGNKQAILGVNSDHIVTIYTLVSCVSLGFYFFVKNNIEYNKKHVIYILFLGAYFIINIIAYGIQTNNLVISHAIYTAITLCFIVFFKDKTILLSYLIAIGLFFVSCFLLIQLYNLGFGEWGRLTVPVLSNMRWSYFPNGYTSSSDPNVLAFMLAIFSIYIFFTLPNKIIANVVFILSMTCSFLTLSRSSFLAFWLSFLIVSMYSFFILKRKQLRLFILIILSIFCSFGVIQTAYNANTSKLLTERTLSTERSNDDRIVRIKVALTELNNIKTFSIGKGIGYSASTLDPHNLYLSTIIDSGIIILFVIIVLVTKPLLFFFKQRIDSDLFLCCMCITLYFLLISLFYWQVRVLYLVVILLYTIVNAAKKDTINV